MRGMSAMKSIKDAIGDLFSKQGIVRHAQYDEAKDALSQMKKQIIADFAKSEQERKIWEYNWPYESN